MDSTVRIQDIFKDFSKNTGSPENFICAQPHLESPFRDCTTRLYDFCSDCSINKSKEELVELITEGLDSNQIWEEIELTNAPLLKCTVHDVAKVRTGLDSVTLVRRSPKKQAKPDSDGKEVASDEERSTQEYDGSQDLFLESQEDAAAEESDSSDMESETNFDFDDLEAPSEKRTKKPSTKKQPAKGFPGRTSVVDDSFFKLSEMERFLEMEDAKEERRRKREEAGRGEEEDDDLGDDDDDDDDEESIDIFDDIPSEEESDDGEHEEKSARDLVYSDYFEGEDQTPSSRQKRVHFQEPEMDEEDEDDMDEGLDEEDNDDEAGDSHEEEEEEEEEEESEGEDVADILGQKKEVKSSFESRQEKLRQKIAQLEQANIAQKPWQLTGEAKSSKRPENSLMEEDLDFEVTSKPAPVITEETTQALEDVIRQRIMDRAWDDVERKTRRVEQPYEFKKRVTLDQDKSKLSLAEIYEKEYLKQSEQLKEDEENPAHTDIKKMMDALFVKLDALSNFHFMPKPVLPEVKIVSNVPSISMEEVAPITATDASLLAPEEIQEKPTSELKGDSEKTASDKKQALRQKKKGQKARAQDKLTKEKAKAGAAIGKQSMKGALRKLEQDSKQPSSKTTIIKDSSREKALKSSKSFFGRLQDEVTSEIRGIKTKRKAQQPTLSGKKLKL